MLTHKPNRLFIYFGDATDSIYKSLHTNPTNEKLTIIEPYKSICTKLGVPRLSVLNQTHGIDGVQVINADFSFTRDGDYLITDQIDVGLGVLTADCVPIVLYDEKNHAIAAIHAGWRGSVAEIVPKAFGHMQAVWGSDSADIRVFIGPCAKSCCYVVQKDLKKLIDPAIVNKVIISKNQNLYLDTVHLVALQLNEAGIAPASINKDYNFCTICDNRFFSYRRQLVLRNSPQSEVGGINAGRQITIAHLK